MSKGADASAQGQAAAKEGSPWWARVAANQADDANRGISSATTGEARQPRRRAPPKRVLGMRRARWASRQPACVAQASAALDALAATPSTVLALAQSPPEGLPWPSHPELLLRLAVGFAEALVDDPIQLIACKQDGKLDTTHQRVGAMILAALRLPLLPSSPLQQKAAKLWGLAATITSTVPGGTGRQTPAWPWSGTANGAILLEVCLRTEHLFQDEHTQKLVSQAKESLLLAALAPLEGVTDSETQEHSRRPFARLLLNQALAELSPARCSGDGAMLVRMMLTQSEELQQAVRAHLRWCRSENFRCRESSGEGPGLARATGAYSPAVWRALLQELTALPGWHSPLSPFEFSCSAGQASEDTSSETEADSTMPLHELVQTLRRDVMERGRAARGEQVATARVQLRAVQAVPCWPQTRWAQGLEAAKAWVATHSRTITPIEPVPGTRDDGLGARAFRTIAALLPGQTIRQTARPKPDIRKTRSMICHSMLGNVQPTAR
ncbi:unnamed protein product [Polarella glacialis]|uniref:Uncharacterized protein n=1 Tax=Polarella glacialis TaxID=89957 RepID=A0A813M000_POLGL|nr:unnamed protein product [Polarella glacialis]CAE8743637.1 unnamed protein product [Polarella glacialis]